MCVLHIHSTYMVRRVSLYFEPYAWEKMNRCLSLLLLSGKPMYDLPTMNDLIEGMVIYVSRAMSGLEITTTDLLPYIEGFPTFISKTHLTNEQYNKGRMAFALTPRLEKALSTIRNLSKQWVDEKVDTSSLDGVSDPILIRSCAYYILESSPGLFYDNLYFSFLFGLRPEILSFNPNKYKEEIWDLTDIEKNNLRKVMWDEGVIVGLDVMLEYATSKDDSRHTSLLDFKGSDYHSKGFNFDYLLAYIGFVAFSRAYKQNLSIPELIVDFNPKKTPYDHRTFIYLLTNMKEISNGFNSSILDKKK